MSSDPCSAVVADFRHRHEAEMARGYLTAAGIPSAVHVDDAGGAYAGLVLGAGSAKVLVRGSDVKRARRTLVEAGMSGEASGP